MTETPTIRLATRADCSTVAAMSRDWIEQGLGWSWTAPRVLGALRHPEMDVIVAQDGAAVVGFAIMHFGETKAHLSLLGVAPGLREQGLGSRLLAWLEECARVAGLERIAVEARADNPVALAFYVEQGFRCRDTVPGYYRGIVDAVRMEKPLAVAGG